VEDTGDGMLLRSVKAGQPSRMEDVVGNLGVAGGAGQPTKSTLNCGTIVIAVGATSSSAC
jgi:hypothetical protein